MEGKKSYVQQNSVVSRRIIREMGVLGSRMCARACMHVYACACEYAEIFVGMHAWLFAITEMVT